MFDRLRVAAPAAAVLVMAALSAGAAHAQRSEVRSATVFYNGAGPSEDGYATASAEVRYVFLECMGEIHVQYGLVPGSVRAGPGYYFRGRYQDVPAASAAVGSLDLRATVRTEIGQRVGSILDPYAGTYSGAGCLGQTQKVTTVREWLGEGVPREQVQAFVDSLRLDPALNGAPVLRDAAIEAQLQARARQAEPSGAVAAREGSGRDNASPSRPDAPQSRDSGRQPATGDSGTPTRVPGAAVDGSDTQVPVQAPDARTNAPETGGSGGPASATQPQGRSLVRIFSDPGQLAAEGATQLDRTWRQQGCEVQLVVDARNGNMRLVTEHAFSLRDVVGARAADPSDPYVAVDFSPGRAPSGEARMYVAGELRKRVSPFGDEGPLNMGFRDYAVATEGASALLQAAAQCGAR